MSDTKINKNRERSSASVAFLNTANNFEFRTHFYSPRGAKHSFLPNRVKNICSMLLVVKIRPAATDTDSFSISV